MVELIGQSLGRYHILKQLGEGGMAIVYKARDTNLDRDVAIKVIRTDIFGPAILKRLLERFKREGQALAKLAHPNIVTVLEYGEHNGAPYLVMPYLPGGTLKSRINKPIQYQDAVHLLIPIAQALAHAHEQGIIHRDVKPANILITRTGEPMLSDFGIAKLLDTEETRELTGTGVGIGTPEYMAPEQGMGQSDERADIYALGIVFYELVTGRIPYRADTPMAILMKKSQEPLPRPKSFVPSLPDSVENVLIKVLARDPNNRYQTAREFADALERLARGETVTREISKSSKPNSAWLWVGLGALVIILVVFLIDRLTGRGVAEALPTSAPANISTSTPFNTQTPSDTNTPRVTSTPELNIGSVMTGNDGMTLLYVPAGEFTMGNNDGNDKEKPAHTVYLDAYWMDQTEVTTAMYAKCVDAGACKPPSDTSSYTRSSYYGNSQFNNYPIIFVDWYQAKNYCEWVDGRLPTEAEWEKAARGTDGRIYSWGNNYPNSNLLNYNGENDDTQAVGSYPGGASPYGLLDMAGNVWEWVADWYDKGYYVHSPSSNPLGPSSGEFRVMRGGSWSYTANEVRSASRFSYDPSVPYGSIGFRCARSP
jgi:serine/threonine protein kinase